jgi:hypothetical protein
MHTVHAGDSFVICGRCLRLHCVSLFELQWSEQGQSIIRYCSPGGFISSLVNIYRTTGATGDGSWAILAKLNNPTVASDGVGGYIISDSINNVLRRIVR